jgi:hypothetical protein
MHHKMMFYSMTDNIDNIGPIDYHGAEISLLLGDAITFIKSLHDI